jgi:hypothetical protein
MVPDVTLILLSAFYNSDNFCILPYQKELVESRNLEREKLKEDYSLLESSDFQVEASVNCPRSTVPGQLNERSVHRSTVVYCCGSITSISTLATPLPIIPSTFAAPADKSMSRSPT